MAKKLRSYRVLSCTLAVLATIAFIVACGEGQVIEIIKGDMEDSESHAKGNYSSVLANAPSSTQPQSSSSDGEQQPSDRDSSSSEEFSLSSWEQPSSASLPSSSSEESSSASESLYTLECKVLPDNSTFPAGTTKISKDKRPEITCIEKANPSNVETLDQENDVLEYTSNDSRISWNALQSGVYNNIRVKIDRDNKGPCHKLEAACTGSITIAASPSSSSYTYIPPSSNSTPPVTPSSNSTPSSSSRANTTTSSSSVASSGTKGPCLVGGNKRYCKWSKDGACDEINSEHGYISGDGGCSAGNCTCDALIKNCTDYGYLYGSSTCSGTDLNGKNPDAVTILGCCKWGNNNCWTLQSDAPNKDCPNLLTSGKACPNSPACP